MLTMDKFKRRPSIIVGGHADSRAESDVPLVCGLHDARVVSHMTSVADGRFMR